MVGRRVVWPEQAKASVEDFAIPKINQNEVLVSTEVTLISPGTERAWLLGLPNTPGSFPFYPGYSSIGRITGLGNKVKKFTLGDRVASMKEHSSHVVLHPADLIRITDDSMESEEAAFFNLCAICLQGVRKANIELGDSVLIIGQGLIGLITMQLARLSGAFPVIAADLAKNRLKLSKDLGADFTLNPEYSDIEHEISEITMGKGPAVVFEATGSPEAIITAFKVARPCGRVVLIASTRGETDKVDFYQDVHKKGLIIIGAHNAARPLYESSPRFWTMHDDCELALKLISQKRLLTDPLISHRLPWENASEAYDMLMKWDTDLLGVVLDWSST